MWSAYDCWPSNPLPTSIHKHSSVFPFLPLLSPNTRSCGDSIDVPNVYMNSFRIVSSQMCRGEAWNMSFQVLIKNSNADRQHHARDAIALSLHAGEE